MDKEKFCESVYELILSSFNREQEIIEYYEQDVEMHPAQKVMIKNAEFKEYINIIHPLLLKIVESSGVDTEEFQSIVYEHGQNKLKKIKEHQEWYKSQEFDV